MCGGVGSCEWRDQGRVGAVFLFSVRSDKHSGRQQATVMASKSGRLQITPHAWRVIISGSSAVKSVVAVIVRFTCASPSTARRWRLPEAFVARRPTSTTTSPPVACVEPARAAAAACRVRQAHRRSPLDQVVSIECCSRHAAPIFDINHARRLIPGSKTLMDQPIAAAGWYDPEGIGAVASRGRTVERTSRRPR